MTYPTFYPYRTHVLNATAASSNSSVSTPVPFRGVLLSVSQSNNVTPTALQAGVFDVCQNGSTGGSTVAGLGGLIATTGAIGSGGSVTYTPSDLVYLNAGDILVTVVSSQVAASYAFAIKEA